MENAPLSVPEADSSRTVVLIAEDHDRQYSELLKVLHCAAVDPIRVCTGPEAIKMAAAHRPRLIFLDGLLPGMHGFEVARFIRHMDTGYRPYIVMLTAIYKNVRYENEAKLRYGVDEYVAKPLTVEKLSGILARVTAPAQPTAGAA